MIILFQIATNILIISNLNLLYEQQQDKFCSQQEDNHFGQVGCPTTPISLSKIDIKNVDFAIFLGDITTDINYQLPLNQLTFQFHLFNISLFPVFGYHDVFNKPKSIYSVHFNQYQQYNLFGRYGKEIRHTFEKGGYYSILKNNALLIFLNVNYEQFDQFDWLDNLLVKTTAQQFHLFISDYQLLQDDFKTLLQQYELKLTVHTQFNQQQKILFKMPNVIYHSTFNLIDRQNYSYRTIKLNPKLIEFNQFMIEVVSQNIVKELSSLQLSNFNTGFSKQTILDIIQSMQSSPEFYQKIERSTISQYEHSLLEYCAGHIISPKQLQECLSTGEVY